MSGSGASLPQEIFLRSMREEIEHFLVQSNLGAEFEEERRLFEQLKQIGEQLNQAYALDELPLDESSTKAGFLKNLARRLLRPLFRLVLGPRFRRQGQFRATLIQFSNAMSQLETQVVSTQRHYKAHLSNLSQNLVRVLELLHQSDLRINEKFDLLFADLDRQVTGLRQAVLAANTLTPGPSPVYGRGASEPEARP